MLRVEYTKQWVASTVGFDSDDAAYLRLSNTATIWYKLINEKWEWIEDSAKLEEAWVSRGGIPFEDIQTFGG